MVLRTVQRECVWGRTYCSSAIDAEQSEICSRWLSSSVMTDICVVKSGSKYPGLTRGTRCLGASTTSVKLSQPVADVNRAVAAPASLPLRTLRVPSAPHHTTPPNAASPIRARRPLALPTRTSLTPATHLSHTTAAMADSMEGVVTAAEKPTAEQTEQQTIAGEYYSSEHI